MRFDHKHRKALSESRKRLLASGFQSKNAKRRAVPDISGISEPFGHWLAGFVAGEGHFGISRQDGLFHPSFKIALRSDDEAVLYEICSTLGFGKMSYYHTKTTHVAAFGVYAYAEAIALIALFRRFPLRAKKQLDFESWARCVEYGHAAHQPRIADIQHELDFIHKIRHPAKKVSGATSAGQKNAVKPLVKSRKRWRHRRGDSCHYYEDANRQLGHIIKQSNLYRATGKGLPKTTFKTLREAKRFVEKIWRRK